MKIEVASVNPGKRSVSEEAGVLYWKIFSVWKYGGVYMDTNILFADKTNFLRWEERRYHCYM